MGQDESTGSEAGVAAGDEPGGLDFSLGPPADETHALRFTGKGSEYFGIWIVNLLLSIITLGIYSAWAKVRRLQYFYRNTQLAGASFDYHGNPVAILKGRLIALGMLVLYNVAASIDPLAGLVVAAVLVAFLPRLLRKSLQFRLHNSSYRGLRFRFDGKLKDAYVAFLLWPLATVFSLYLLAPVCHQRIKQFQHGNAAFGQANFSFSAPVRAFYWLYLKLFGILLGGVLVVGVLTAALFGGAAILANGQTDRQAMALFPVVLFLGFFLLFFFIRPFFEAQLQNLVWNHTRLGAHRFVSTVSAWRLFAIMLGNLLGVVLTLGLYRPFAVTRLLKYRLQTVTLVSVGSLDNFVAGQEAEVGATGEEAAEMFDIDIAL